VIRFGRWWTGKHGLAAASATVVAVVAALLTILPNGPSQSQVGTGVALSGMTFARDSGTTCRTDAGYTTLGVDTPCIETDGLLIQSQFSIGNGRSEDLTAAYWSTNGATLTHDGPTGPTGAASFTMTESIGNNFHYVIHGAGGGVVQYHAIVDAKAGTASFIKVGIGQTSAVFDLSTGQVCNLYPLAPHDWWFAQIEPLSGGWYRVHANNDGAAGAGFFYINMGDTCANAYNGAYVGTGKTVYIASAEYSPSPVDISYFKTATDNEGEVRSADVAYWTNPLSNTDTSWCVRANATPGGAPPLWTEEGKIRGLWQLGNTLGAANTASLYVDATGHLVFRTVDSGATDKRVTTLAQVWPGVRTIRACNSAGTLTLSVDGTALTTVSAGAGTGQISTMPSRFYVGSLGGVSQFDGRFNKVCLDKLGGPTSCPVSLGFTARTLPNSFAVVGDSITQCAGGPVCWPTALQAFKPDWTIFNGAVGGTYALDQLTAWRATVMDGGYQYVAQMDGINAPNSTDDISAALAASYRMYAEIDATGAVAIPMFDTPTDSVDVSLDEWQRQQRASRADWAATTGRAFIDTWSSFVDAGSSFERPVLSDIYQYNTDGVHLNDAGETLIATIVKAKLETLGFPYQTALLQMLPFGPVSQQVADGGLKTVGGVSIADIRDAGAVCTPAPDKAGAATLTVDQPCVEPKGLRIFSDGGVHDYASVANPLSSGSAFCAHVEFEPENTAWDTFAILDVGPNGAANTWRLEASTGHVLFGTVDNAGAARTFTSTATLTAGRHKLYVCNSSGTLTAAVDGADWPGTTTGAGTGVLASQPGTVYFGVQYDGGAYGPGWVDKLCADDGATSCGW
jgi:hypothetical protein